MAKTGLSEAAKKRVKAGRMLLKGSGCAEVALTVGVARQTVYTWKRLLDEGGIDALRGVPERGRPAQLDERQLASLRAAILQNPSEHGFGTELWTLKRVGAVIERLHGVRFSQTQIWRILGSLGFSPQKPEKRAIERDEDAVRSWKRSTWPALKKSPARGPADRLRGRVRHQRAPNPRTHLGAQGADAHHPVSLQLEPRFCHRPPSVVLMATTCAGCCAPLPVWASGQFFCACCGLLCHRYGRQERHNGLTRALEPWLATIILAGLHCLRRARRGHRRRRIRAPDLPVRTGPFGLAPRHEHPDGLRHHLVQLIRNSITWSKVFVHTELVLLVSHYPRPLRFEPPSEIARKHRGVSILASVIRNHTPAGAIAVRYRQHGYCSLTVFELSLHQMHSSGISHRHGIGTTQCGNGICRSWRMGQFFLETPKFGLAQEPPSSNRRRGALCWACF